MAYRRGVALKLTHNAQLITLWKLLLKSFELLRYVWGIFSAHRIGMTSKLAHNWYRKLEVSLFGGCLACFTNGQWWRVKSHSCQIGILGLNTTWVSNKILQAVFFFCDFNFKFFTRDLVIQRNSTQFHKKATVPTCLEQCLSS